MSWRKNLLDNFMTVKEVATLCECNNQVVLNHIKRGTIKAEKRGWNWFIPKSQASKLKAHLKEISNVRKSH